MSSLQSGTGTGVVSLEDVVTVTTEVWTCFLGQGDSFVPSYGGEDLGTHLLEASIEITGAWSGRVSLELTAASAEAAARLMIGRPVVSATDVVDAVGELVNMIGGNLKGLVPAPSALGLPHVSKGTGALANGRDAVATSTADFLWQGRPVRISVWEPSQPSEG